MISPFFITIIVYLLYLSYYFHRYLDSYEDGEDGTMITFLAYVLAFMGTFPVIITFLVFRISRFLSINKKKSFHIAMNYTTILYIISTSVIWYILSVHNIFLYTIILLLLLFINSVFICWKKDTDILFKKVLYFFWRLTFLIFFLAHMLSIIVGLSLYIIRYSG